MGVLPIGCEVSDIQSFWWVRDSDVVLLRAIQDLLSVFGQKEQEVRQVHVCQKNYAQEIACGFCEGNRQSRHDTEYLERRVETAYSA